MRDIWGAVPTDADSRSRVHRVSSNIPFERTNQQLTLLGQLVYLPVTVSLGNLNHVLLSKLLEMCVDIATAQIELLCKVVAIGRFVTDDLQNPQLRLRDEPHFSEDSDTQRLKTVNGISESQTKQTSNRTDITDVRSHSQSEDQP